MTADPGDTRRVVVHLTAQSTVDFGPGQLWPSHGEYLRFGTDLNGLAEEVARRLRTDGYLGFNSSDGHITLMPFAAIARIDFQA